MSAVPAPENPWLLPAALVAEPAGTRRRSTRDWIVDGVAFGLAVAYLVWAAWDLRQPQPTMTAAGPSSDWLYRLDVALGLVGCAAIWVRRRWPLALVVLAAPVGLLSVTGGIALLVLLFTLAVHRPFLIAAAATAGHLVLAPVYYLVYPDPDLSLIGAVSFTGLVLGAVLAWGMFVRARRQLILSLRDRAHRAEAEQQLRVSQARQLERTRIAREMHDVLAHRISLLSLHAGALEFRPDAPREEVTRAAGVIRVTAHQALQDLREVIGVLRTDPAPDDRPAEPSQPPQPPQPTLADLPALVDESRQAGARVRLVDRIDGAPELPTGLGRTAYRIVQEGLTNSRKHAPGAAARVTMTGRPGDGLTIEVVNRKPLAPAATAIPGTGTGLVGLAERAALAGGRLVHGPTETGDFRLAVWLPWPT
ncbi:MULTISPECIES: sensor histidine kinase [unclassified Solwaraspora]|uniref:sensor histidine kinase n=1 Tax=unclassified Solwaraspora TaxID=2627926 RepID=UPI00259B0BCA|nr:histidine kinase [Solwaraspora sp. WMMA2056]WJK42701.1 histidine kinase [Solwaraspora sp. WMMA2056]